MARELRRRGVPKRQVPGTLGHLPDGSRAAEDYAGFAPDYLGQAVPAIDAVFADVGRAGGRLSRSIVLPVASVRASRLSRSRGTPCLRSGADGIRTHDLDGANVALSQLSYGPSTPYLAEVAGIGKGRRTCRGAA